MVIVQLAILFSKVTPAGAPLSLPLLRKSLLRGWVNQACLAYYFALYETTSPAVTWGGFGAN